MAIRYAVATGNWSSTATWNGGTLPTSADDVYANNFTVTINQNVTVLSLNTTAASGVNNGGAFFFAAGNFTVVADTIQAGNGTVLTVGGAASGTYTITANTMNAGITPNTGAVLFINSASSNVIITGNINAYAGAGIDAPSCVSTTINGNVTANAGSVGINHRGPGTYTINGFCQGSVGSFGYSVNTPNPLTVGTITKAISINNGFAGVNSSFSSVPSVTVKEIEQGIFGQVPISGFVRLSSASGAFYKGITPAGSVRTLSDPADIAGQVPAQSDVRFGVTYQSGAKTGTAYIPSPSSVGFGVPVDNTTGTAALTPASVWDAATSSLTTSGSIGERLKNASTVDTTGDQLAALL
jgi:hypothetical protein